MMYDFNLRPISGHKPAAHPATTVLTTLAPAANSGSSTVASAPSKGAPEQLESASAIQLRNSQKALLLIALVSNSALLALLYFGGFLS